MFDSILIDVLVRKLLGGEAPKPGQYGNVARTFLIFGSTLAIVAALVACCL